LKFEKEVAVLTDLNFWEVLKTKKHYLVMFSMPDTMSDASSLGYKA